MVQEVLKILFVCGRNKRRSPTAVSVFRNDPRMSVRCGGTSETSVRRVAEDDLKWADLICVMERKYEARLRERFADLAKWPRFHCLGIPDDYERNDPDLMQLLKDEVEPLLSRLGESVK